MSVPRFFLALPGALLLTAVALGQSSAADDGFQRHNGTMYLIRNGTRRPMPHDVHLPNGRQVTRDGFVVERDGRRTELSEGQGCSLTGAVAAVAGNSSGQLRLAVSGRSTSAPASRGTSVSAAGYLRQLVGPGRHRGRGHYKKGKHGKGRKHH